MWLPAHGLVRAPSPRVRMPILTWMGATVIAYLADHFTWWDRAIAAEVCPCCGGTLRWHSQRDRAAWTHFLHRADERIPLLRVYCTHCKNTHTLLPDFLTPRHRYQTPVREAVVTGAESAPPCCAQTRTRWRRAVKRVLPDVIHQVRSWLLTEAPPSPRQDQRLLTVAVRGVEGLRVLCRLAGEAGRAATASSLFGWVNREFGFALPEFL